MLEGLTVVIPFRGGNSTIARLLDSLPSGLPVILVDDQAGTDPYQSNTSEKAGFRLIVLGQRSYFSGAVNAGIAACAGDVLVLNQDSWIEGEAWIAWLAEVRAQGHAIAGTPVFGHPSWPNGYVQGQFMYLSRGAISRVGLLNERDYPLWGATAEWQVRACRAGFSAKPEAPPGFGHARASNQPYGESIRAALATEPDKRGWFIRTPPAVSVIVTSRSYGHYLPDCIHSLIGGETSLGPAAPQTLQSFEVIIVDDGSTDETARVGRALADPWKGVRYLRRDRSGGTPAANNAGIRATHGEYITILCADDMREPNALESLYRAQIANPHALIYDDCCAFANGERLGEFPTGKKEYDFERLVERNYIHAGIMFPRRAWEQVGGYAEAMRFGREDWQFNVALGCAGYCGVHVKELGYLYRREGQNRSLTNASGEWRNFFVSQMRELFPDLYQGVRPMGCCGGGKRMTSKTKPNGASAVAEAASGETLVEYIGTSSPQTYHGAVSKKLYTFGGKYKLAPVDSRDVEALLALRQNRNALFKLAEVAEASAPQGEVKDEEDTDKEAQTEVA